MAIANTKLVTQSLAKQIAESIRDAILDGQLKVDDRLPTEEELAQQFAVSRPTVREALKRLAAQHLVRSQRGPTGGTFITRPSETELRATLANSTRLLVTLGEFDIDAITEARRQMQRVCLALAIKRRSEADLQRIQHWLEQQQHASSDEAFCAADVGFHRALVDACGNPVLQFNMVTVIEALQPLMNMIANRTRDRIVIIGHHQALLKALEQQHQQQAEASLDQLLDYLQIQYQQARQPHP